MDETLPAAQRSSQLLPGQERSCASRSAVRNFEVTEELCEHVEKRFQRVGNQVSNLALLDVEFSEKAPLRGFEPRFPD